MLLHLHKPRLTRAEATKVVTVTVIIFVGFETFCLYGFWTHKQLFEAAAIVIAWGKEGVKKVVEAFIANE